MNYPVIEKLITMNRNRRYLTPTGWVIHSTATPGATARNEFNYFNTAYRGASVHYFCDWTEIIRTIPENEQAGHAGYSANIRFLSVEMCEPMGHNPEQFQEVWNRTVELVADWCFRKNKTSNEVWSHKGVSEKWGETDHTDPMEFLQKYGRTWEELLKAIDTRIQEMNGKGDGLDVKAAVLCYSFKDLGAGLAVVQAHENCALYIRNEDKTFNPDCFKSETLFVVGGATVGHKNEVLLSGQDSKETLQKVIDAL